MVLHFPRLQFGPFIFDDAFSVDPSHIDTVLTQTAEMAAGECHFVTVSVKHQFIIECIVAEPLMH